MWVKKVKDAYVSSVSLTVNVRLVRRPLDHLPVTAELPARHAVLSAAHLNEIQR